MADIALRCPFSLHIVFLFDAGILETFLDDVDIFVAFFCTLTTLARGSVFRCSKVIGVATFFGVVPRNESYKVQWSKEVRLRRAAQIIFPSAVREICEMYFFLLTKNGVSLLGLMYSLGDTGVPKGVVAVDSSSLTLLSIVPMYLQDSYTSPFRKELPSLERTTSGGNCGS